jgi:hypothetical protein
MPTLDVRPGSTLRISNRRLDEIIMLAYGVGGKQIAGPRRLTELTRLLRIVTPLPWHSLPNNCLRLLPPTFVKAPWTAPD